MNHLEQAKEALNKLTEGHVTKDEAMVYGLASIAAGVVAIAETLERLESIAGLSFDAYERQHEKGEKA